MPQFLITSPDGKKFKVNAPEGATREDALAKIKAQYQAPKQEQLIENVEVPLEDFKGEQPQSKPQPQDSSWTQTMKARGADLADVVDRYKQGEQTLPETIYQGGMKATIGTVGDVVGEGLSAVTPDLVKEKLEPVAKFIVEQPLTQEAMKAFSELSPRAQANLEATGLLPVGFVARSIGKGVKSVAQSAPVQSAIKAVDKKLYSVGESLEEGAKAITADNKLASATNTILPKETAKKGTENAKRMISKGGFNDRFEYDPTAFEKDIAKNLVDTTDFKKGQPLRRTMVQIKEAREGIAKDLQATLEKSDVAFQQTELDNVLMKAVSEIDDLSLVGDSEKLAEKYLNRAQKIYAKNNMTPAGLLKSRKEFDRLVEDGKKAYAFDSNEAKALNKVVATIRTKMNDFLSEKVPDVSVKDKLRKQHLLYEAENNIAPKAAKEGKTRLERGTNKALETVKKRQEALGVAALTFGTSYLGAAQLFSTPVAAAVGAGATAVALRKLLLKNPRLKMVAGKALKSLGKKGNLKDLAPNEQKLIADELKLLPPPTNAGD
jgi:hypothetical protein